MAARWQRPTNRVGRHVGSGTSEVEVQAAGSKVTLNAPMLCPAGVLPRRRRGLRAGARGLLVGFVLERQAEPYAVAGHRTVLDGHVLTHDLGDAQAPHGSGGSGDRVAGRRFPGLATGPITSVTR